MKRSELPKLLIGTPAYGGMVHVDYLNSISAFHRSDLQFDLMTLANESLITRARNTIFSFFCDKPEYTHLLFLDGDVHLPLEGLQSMIDRDVDVIGAPVAMKSHHQLGQRIFSFGACLGEQGSLFKVSRIATAALLISRKAINALQLQAIEEGKVYQITQHSKAGNLPEKYYDVFLVGAENGEYVSEDYGICDRLRGLGFSVFVDPTVVTRHQGVMAF